jgi:N-methylhydantoinase B
LYSSGVKNATLFELLESNVRFPKEVIGDVGALTAACNVTTARLIEFLEDTGLSDMAMLSDEIGRRAVQSFSKAASRIPAGTYSYTHMADGLAPAGVGEAEPIKIAVTIESDGKGRLSLDFTGTSPQIPRAPINVPIPYTLSDATYALQYVLKPEISNVGPSYNLFDIHVPPGCILGALPPVPVYARTRTGVHIATAIMGALAQALPGEIQAGCGHNVIMKVSGVRPSGQYYGIGLMPKGGMGGMAGIDGWSVTVFPTNCTMISSEAFEIGCGLLMNREMLVDSGGAGEFRGGVGQRVTMTNAGSAAVYVSVRSNFVQFPPPGLLGGQPGGLVQALYNDGPLPENPVTLKPGDVLMVDTAGGGGFGDPLKRNPEAVLSDVTAGFVSMMSAANDYGVVVDLTGGTARRGNKVPVG